MQKGNILIVVLFLITAVLVLFSEAPGFFKTGETGQKKTEYRDYSFQPVFKKESLISAVKEVEQSEKESEQQQEQQQQEEEPDTTPPLLLNPLPAGGLPFQTRKIYLSLQTDEPATCRYADASGFYYEYMQGKFSTEQGFFHRAEIGYLDSGQSYKFYVRCMDRAGNKNMEDLIISFWVEEPEDTTPPQRSHFYPQGEILPPGTQEIVIGVTTDEPAFCRFAREAGISYRSMDYRFNSDEHRKRHTYVLQDLEDGRLYGFYVRCKDLNGNENTGDILISFEVAPSP